MKKSGIMLVELAIHAARLRQSRRRPVVAVPAWLPLWSLPAALFAFAILPAHAQQGAPASNQEAPGGPATTQTAVPGPGGTSPPVGVPSPGQPGWVAHVFDDGQTTLLGDIYGLRTALDRHGVTLGLQETDELSGNVSGGIRRGADYKGLTFLGLGVDTAKAGWWQGGILNVSAYQIHGRDLSVDNLLVLQTNSGTEAQRSTRLWEAWYQQTLLSGKLDVKVGQQSLDNEFIVSTNASLFINGAFGYPAVPSLDQYGGGPAYPLSSLGVRVRAQPRDDVTILAGVFDDNPPGGPFNNDPQVRGASQSGTSFNLHTGALAIAEAQYSLNAATTDAAGKSVPHGLPGTYKLGGWYDTGRFPDQRFDTAGVSLASPSSNGDPRQRRGDWAVYAVADQVVWRPDPDGARTVSLFASAVGGPGDRNLANLSLYAGATLKAPLPGRDKDTVGLGYGLTKIGSNAVRLDQDAAGPLGLHPVRGSESFVELTYQAQLAPWLALQPSAEYFWTPGGGIANPLDPGHRVGNAATFTLRSNVVF